MTGSSRPYGAINGPVPYERNIRDWNGFLFIGEAPGANEVLERRPFVGPAGRLLDQILAECRVDRGASMITNVFSWQPSWTADNDGKRRNNDITSFFTRDEAVSAKGYRPYRGMNLHIDHAPDLERLRRIVEARKPRRIITLGATALWGITGFSRIKEVRGQFLGCPFSDAPVCPTWHTAHALHRGDDRIVAEIRADIAAATAD